MSLGITELKAAASKIWSCAERVQEFLKNQLMFCSLCLSDETTCQGEVSVSKPVTENPMKTPQHNTAPSD